MSSALRSGAIAGCASALVFTVVHDIFISDIWSTLPQMLFFGGLSGFSVAWTFRLLIRAGGIDAWLRYNATYVGLFVILGAVSEAVYTPVTHMALLVDNSGPLDELIVQALPMFVPFVLAGSGLIVILFGRRPLTYLPVLLTFALLMVGLGLNVGIIGLVEIPVGSWYLIGELLGLIVVLNAVYALRFVALEWRAFRTRGTSPAASP